MYVKYKKIDNTSNTRNTFLVCIAAVYMLAFGSIYVQLPGLYGRNGIMPISSLMQSIKDELKSKTAESLFMNTPTLLWFMPLDPDVGLELLAILGVTLSFLCLICQRIRIFSTYLTLWLLYLSIYKVGETFMWFQWDILLLEVGAITILVAPVLSSCNEVFTGVNIHRQIPFYLVKWLLFRLMFASGVVKLTSKCPTWWGLTALNYHYESQCIPTPLAWWAHQLPDAVQQLSVIVTYIIEIGFPFFFFMPFRLPRLIAAYGQLILMIAIYLSGNYNFFNILTAVLCLSLIDDDHLDYVKYCLTLGCLRFKDAPVKMGVQKSSYTKLLKLFFNLSIFSYSLYVVLLLFGYENGKFKIKFSLSNLQEYLSWILPCIVWISVLSFLVTVVKVLFKLILIEKGFKKCFVAILKFLIIFGPSTYLFNISMVRFADVDPSFRSNVWPVANKWYQSSMKFDLVHSYGLFRRMTGVGGRPEVIIEGSNEKDKMWKEYHFIYKPGYLKGSLPWAAPHQPRLDWQMWFAALGSYQHNPWIISLMHRLLNGQSEVLELLDLNSNPFPDKPPKFIRAQLYHYHFTNVKRDLSAPIATWRREFKNSYVPVLTKDDPKVLEFLKYNKLLPKPIPKKKRLLSRSEIFVRELRSIVKPVYPPTLLWSLILTALAVSLVKSYFSSDED